MHILFLTQIVPYPPDAGPKVKTWHVLKYLSSRGHRITLATFVRPDERRHLGALEEICAAVHAVPIRRSRAADVLYWLRSHWTGRPFLVERDDSAAMRALVRSILDAEPVDIIHADQLTMAQFAFPDPSRGGNRPGRVFDAHNAVWMIVDRMARNASALLRPVMALEARRVRRYEGRLVAGFDRVLAVTEVDRAALEQVAPPGTSSGERIVVIPIAVDTAELKPVRPEPGSMQIVTLGTLHYPPNADGIRWFLNEVYPQIRRSVPQAHLTIIGKNPPADFLQAAAKDPDAVTVTGYVPDLEPYMRSAAVVVVPVRAGGGMRVRILEAFARALPVITTTVGLEGIAAEPGQDVIVKDGPDEFALAVMELLRDPAARARLAERGRELVERAYDWHVVLGELDRVYRSLMNRDVQP
jgi:glycosyltransferase involved in cell wall biosynthesis